MKTETFSCDIKDCKNKAVKIGLTLDVIFHTEQTEGRGTAPHISRVTIDLCQQCYDNVVKGNYIHGAGAMGYNKYWFNNPQTSER
jgi:hypothetical protein